jgi:O-succinylbenzoate synthase
VAQIAGREIVLLSRAAFGSFWRRSGSKGAKCYLRSAYRQRIADARQPCEAKTRSLAERREAVEKLRGLEGVVPPSRCSRTGKAETVGVVCPVFMFARLEVVHTSPSAREVRLRSVTATFINSSSSLHSIHHTLTPTID